MSEPSQLNFGEGVVQTSAPAAAAPPPALVEFPYEGKPWRCGRFDLLAAEFELKPEDLAAFVDAAHVTDRGWLVTRRLFGLQPVVPPVTTPMDDLRPWSRQELQEALGLTRGQLAAELNAVRGSWRALRPKAEPVAAAEALKPSGLFDEEELLEQYGFAMKFDSSAEKTWFCQRVQDYAKVLNEKFAAVLARDALIIELRIYQLDALMNDPEKCKRGDGQWHANLKVRQSLSERYQKLLDQIKGMCPWAGAIAGKYNFGGSLGDVTRGIQEYKARGGTELIDGIFTLTEVLIDVRMSVQAPEPHYRADIRVYAAEAKAGLWDFRWSSKLELPALRHLRAAWTAAFMAAHEAAGGKVPDLAADGPESEHDDLPDLTKLMTSAAETEQSKDTTI